MGNDIVFYDIPSSLEGPMQWSPNTLKTRYTLGVKGIPFDTVWVEYPDIEKVAKELGAKQTGGPPSDRACWTLPIIHDKSTNTVLANSLDIALYLDARFPDTPRVFPPQSLVLQKAFQVAFENTALAGWWHAILPYSHSVLNPRSQAFFRRTREERLGPLEEISPRGSAKRAELWEKIVKGMDMLNSWFEGNEGRWAMGDTVSYADITIAGYLKWFKTVMPADEWAQMASWHGGKWAKFVDDFEQCNVEG